MTTSRILALVRSNWERISRAGGVTCDVVRGQHPPIVVTTRGPVAIDGGWSLTYPDGAWYQVRLGGSVTITASDNDGNNEEALLRRAGPVTALVMAVSGFYPFHACGIAVSSGTVAIFAPSGGGKSTLSAVAADAGFQIAGDDLLVVDREGSLLPIHGSLRVEETTAPSGWEPLARLHDGRCWYNLPPIAPSQRLLALCRLDRGLRCSFTPVTGARRLATLAAAGLLTFFGDGADDQWQAALLDLAERTPVWELTVPEGLAQLRSEWPRIADWLSST